LSTDKGEPVPEICTGSIFAVHMREIEMRKMLLAAVAVVLLSNGALAIDGERQACVRFLENGGMGARVDKGTAGVKCDDLTYRAQVLKTKGTEAKAPGKK
jgi:hypothetical protein